MQQAPYILESPATGPTQGPDAMERLRAAKELNENLRRERTLKLNYGIHFYRPHLKQYRFHASAATGRYMRFGNRGGKSDCGIVEDLSMCLGQRPWAKKVFPVLQGDRTVAFTHQGHEHHPLVTLGIPQRPVKGLIIVVDWDMSQRIFFNRTGSNDAVGKFWRFIPREAIGKCRVDGKGRYVEIEIKRPRENGGGSSTLTIDTVHSYKNSKLGAESADWDFIHVDEPCPQPMFEAHSRGLMDRAGRYWFNCTPLDEMWINDEFTPPKCRVGFDAPDGIEFEKKLEGSEHKPTRFVITGSIYDNPHRSDVGVAEFESTLTRDQKACRLYGIPTAMAGLVYKSFEYDAHVLEQVPEGWASWTQPPPDYTIRWWWDYHTRLPQAVLFFATDPKGRVFVYDELFDDNHIDPVCKKILAKTTGRNVIDQEIDPFALIPHPVTRESVQDELAKYELFPVPATKDLTTGIIKTDQRLAEREGKLPTIFFSPHLTQTLYEFQHYVYDAEKNEPKDKDNHMMENLYRAVLNGLAYVDPSPSKFIRRTLRVRPNEHEIGFRPPTNYK